MIVKVKVKSGNGEPEINGDTVTVYTKAKREQNRANMDVMRQLSRLYNVDYTRIKLVRGQTSTNKVFLLQDRD